MITTVELYKLFLDINKISTDTRKDVKDSIFFSLKGDNFDGNKFADFALNKGATYAVIDNEKYKNNEQFILVDNVLQSLQDIASFHRSQLNLTIIGLTGSNGKTTTKELITAILLKKYKIVSTQGNLNNQIGLPLTVLSIKQDHEIAVIEMGANHPGEIYHLCNIARPQYGLITNIGKAHLEGFGSIQGVTKAKSEMYRYLHENDGKAFVNIDNKKLNRLSSNISRITYGSSDEANCKAQLVNNDSLVELIWKSESGNKHISSKLFGKYNFENILAAVCVGNYFNTDADQIIEAIEEYQPLNNRSQIIHTDNNKIIMDAYNANPSSMDLFIDELDGYRSERKTIILGDMLELGKHSFEEHKKVMSRLSKINVRQVILIGEYFSKANTNPDWISFQNTDKACKWLEKNPVRNSSVFIKGSRGNQMEKLLSFL